PHRPTGGTRTTVSGCRVKVPSLRQLRVCRRRPVLLDRLLQKVLALIVRSGTLRVTTVAGTSFTVGDGSGPALALRLTSHAAELGLLSDPERASAKPIRMAR